MKERRNGRRRKRCNSFLSNEFFDFSLIGLFNGNVRVRARFYKFIIIFDVKQRRKKANIISLSSYL